MLLSPLPFLSSAVAHNLSSIRCWCTLLRLCLVSAGCDALTYKGGICLLHKVLRAVCFAAFSIRTSLIIVAACRRPVFSTKSSKKISASVIALVEMSLDPAERLPLRGCSGTKPSLEASPLGLAWYHEVTFPLCHSHSTSDQWESMEVKSCSALVAWRELGNLSSGCIVLQSLTFSTPFALL